MEYRIRVQTAMYGDAIPLIHIAEAMARHVASGYGKLPLHGPTLENARPNCIGLLLDAAERGLLTVCDATGRVLPAEEIITAAVMPPAQDGFDSSSRRILALHVRVKHLCDWGRSNGDDFHIEEERVDVIVFDLKNERGEIIKKDYFRGSVGRGATVPMAPAVALPVSAPQAAPASETVKPASVTTLQPPPEKGNSVKHKLRTNSLDVPIARAVKQAASLSTGAVYLKLRELALSGESPFLGTTAGAALCYTDDNNVEKKLTKNALSKRLKSHTL